MRRSKFEESRILLDTYPKTVVQIIENASPFVIEGRGKQIAVHELEKHGHPIQAEDCWNVTELKAMGVDPKCRILEMTIHYLPEEIYDKISLNRKKRK